MPRITAAAFGTALLVLSVSARDVSAQPGDTHLGGGITFRSGQNVQPIFDGWTKNADGSFELHFGYLNRNHIEEVPVPLGAENIVEPGGPDRGQPTYFYPRFNRRVFSVTVPKDWGKREVVWTLTSRGKTERAVGWLQPEWEIDPNPRSLVDKTGKNTPPTISVTNAASVPVRSRLTLTARVTDEGLPPPGKPRVGGNSENPPGFRFDQPTPTAPLNVPEIERTRPRVTGLSVMWQVWRGPAGVTFEPAVSSVKDGQAVVGATFSKPGEYVLRARATDTAATTIQDVRVVVTAADRP